jgi:hypothetical protein
MKNRVYRAVFAGDDHLARSTSATVVVKVAPRVSLRISSSKPGLGDSVKFRGEVKPSHKRDKALLQRYVRHSWETVAKTRVTNKAVYVFNWTIDSKVDFRWRVKVSPDAHNATGMSAPTQLRVR